MTHVVPDLVQKALKGQDPLHILGDGTRSATTRTAATSPTASGSRWSPSGPQRGLQPLDGASTTVLELAEAIWKVHGDGRPFRYVTDPPFEHDVQLRVPDMRKAREVLGLRGDDDAVRRCWTR